MRFISWIFKRLLFWGFILLVGWYCGNRYGAPENITNPVDKAVDETIDYLAPIISEYMAKIWGENDETPENEDTERTTQINAAIADPWAETRRAPLAKLSELAVCATDVSNAPLSNRDGYIIDYKNLARVNGVALLVAPVENGCLSSGVGRRGVLQKMHKGLDFYSDGSRTEILAPADGVIVEAGYRDDYGIQLVLDHGRGVYTRLAHLETLHSGIEVGRTVKSGVPIALMGDSGKYNNTRHLHYEILVGDYNTPQKSFGLKAVDPFTGKSVTEIKENFYELR